MSTSIRDINLKERELEEASYRQHLETLFANEKFIIGILQVVSAAIIGGVISQFKNFTDLVGITTVKIIITTSVASLILSILAAYFKHDYKKWDLKAKCSEGSEKIKRTNKANLYLPLMRNCIFLSTVFLCGGLLVFVFNLWEIDFSKILSARNPYK